MARTDSDRWDLASSVGVTATMVATQRALAHRQELIDDPLAEPLVRAVGHDLFTHLLDGDVEMEKSYPEYVQMRTVDGIVARTRFFDRLCVAAGEAGVRQIVILASGLDSRAYRLPWPDGTVVFEVDQPEVIDFKTRTLSGLGREPSTTRREIGVDLRDDWPTALVEGGFDSSQPTAWIAEGLLIYLPPDAQDRLFDNITELSAANSRLATEFVPDMSVFVGERAQRLSERLKKYGDGLDVSDLVYHGERSDVPEHLHDLGWLVFTHTTREILETNGFDFPEDVAFAPYGNATYVDAELPEATRDGSARRYRGVRG